MRLIDIEDVSLLKTVSVGGLSAKALWRLIKNQRTIEAIPISWIDSYITDSEIGITANNPVNIKMMVEDWTEENFQETARKKRYEEKQEDETN